MSDRKQILEWHEKYYGQLRGFTITDFFLKEDEDDFWPCFQLVKDGHAPVYIEVSRDEEGNGPGFLFLGNKK